MKLYSINGINWIWYIGLIEHEDNTVTVTLHDRLHCERDSHPEATLLGLRFKESPGRIATALIYPDGNNKPLRNPGYVFGFPHF